MLYRLFPIALCLLISLSLQAQESGRIIYTQTSEVSWRGEDHLFTDRWELIFNDSISICRWLPPLEKGNDVSIGGVQMRTYQRENEETFITFLSEKRVKDTRELFRRYFLIEDGFIDHKWKITGKQVIVENYPCMEATYKEDTMINRVYFTPAISLQIGPREWRGLPGMILYLELNNGQSIISVEEMDLSYVPVPEDFKTNDVDIYKNMSWEEFEALKKEKMNERRNMYGH